MNKKELLYKLGELYNITVPTDKLFDAPLARLEEPSDLIVGIRNKQFVLLKDETGTFPYPARLLSNETLSAVIEQVKAL